MHAHRRISILLSVSLLCLPCLAHAQSGGNQLQEIVVTAQRHRQNFNDVGISGSVFSSRQIADSGFRKLNDIADQTPNVQIKDTLANSIPNVTIRGIGLNDYAVNNNPAVGIYVDGVYLVSPAMLTFGLFDLKRIEVLKGPQGDLYGRNTTGGAINFISNKPSRVTDVEMQTGYGNYDSWHFEGAVGGALSKTLTGRFAMQTVQRDSGWQTNYVTGGRVGKIHRTAARLQLDWKPTSSLNLLWNLHGGYDGSDVSLIKVVNVTTTLGSQYAADPYVSGASNHPHMQLKSLGSSLTATWTVNKRLSLTSISAYDHFTRLHVEDRDGTILKELDGTFKNHIDQYSQEVRMTYLGPSLVLIGGVFYSQDLVRDVDSYDSGHLLSLLGLSGFQTIGNQYRQRTETGAAYVHSEWTFAPKWTLVTGARFTDVHKTFGGATTFLIANGVRADVFPPVSRAYSSHDFSGKIGLNYKVLPGTLLYTSVSRGFKSGGFQGQLAFDPSVLTPFKDETLLAYELGAKSRLLHNSLQVNTSVFDYEYHRAQFYGPLFNSPLGVLFGITNVGNARVQGVEADAWWHPTARLGIHVGVGGLRTRIIKSVVPGVTTGSPLPNAPKLTGDFLVRYRWPVGHSLLADVILSGHYQGNLAFDIVRNPPEALAGGYFLADGQLGVATADGHWRVWLWGKNLLNKLYETQALFSSVGWGYSYGAPRTYGIDVSWKR